MFGLRTSSVFGTLIYGGGALAAWWLVFAAALIIGSKFQGRRFEVVCSYVFGMMGLLVGLFWIWSTLFGIHGTNMGSDSQWGLFIAAFFILVGIASLRHGWVVRKSE